MFETENQLLNISKVKQLAEINQKVIKAQWCVLYICCGQLKRNERKRFNRIPIDYNV